MVEELKVIAEMLGGLQGDTLAGVYVYLGVTLTKFIISIGVGVYITKLVISLIRDSFDVEYSKKYKDIINEALQASETIKKWEACEGHDWEYTYSDCLCTKCNAPSRIYR